MKGKIIKGISGFYYVHDGKSSIYQCRAKGIFRKRGVKPVVGDDVEFSVTDARDKEGNIDEILPRKNELIRPLSANVDQALVVFAAADPAPDKNLLDRFLVMMQLRDIPVHVCFNKADLVKTARPAVCEIYRDAGYDVHFLSVSSGFGLDEVRAVLHGKTTILAGPSGVGKSSLTNCLQPEAGMETGSISEKIRRGRHTTRHAELFCVEEDTYLMDTPGFSSLFLEGLTERELKNYFPEFARFVPGCRFGEDCMHIGEPLCGVKDAVKRGIVAASRYENYRLLYQDLKGRRKYGNGGT